MRAARPHHPTGQAAAGGPVSSSQSFGRLNHKQENSLMKKSIVALMVLVGVVGGSGAVSAATAVASNGAKASAVSPAGGGSGAIAVAWNQELLHIVQTPGAQPATIHPTRSFAIVQAAIYDSVVSITKDDRPYLLSLPAPRHARVHSAAPPARP